MTTTTPNMSLILPDVSITAGPQWATLLNTAYGLIDSHDHSSGKGVLITPPGINISSDLTFAQNNATNLRTVRLYPNNTFSPLVTDKTCLYAVGGELVYIDASGNVVQITLNGAVDVSGSITSLSLHDSAFFIQYFGDTSRQFRFNASAIPASTTRILSVPDSGGNDTFVTLAATQTLTNKTLTTPIIAALNTGSYAVTLPSADGSAGQVVKTNGSGVWGFATAATFSQTDVATSATINALSSASNEIRLTGSTTTTVNGITAGSAGSILTVYNVSSAVITFTHNNGSASAANRLAIPNGLSFALRPGASVDFTYDSTQAFWILKQSLATQGVSTNAAAISGEVGEVISSFVSGLNGTTSIAQGATITLPAGDWEVRATMSNSGSTQQYAVMGFNSTTASLSGNTNGLDKNFFNMQDSSGVGGGHLANAYKFSTSTALYLNYFTQAGDASGAFSFNLFARRMR